MDMRAVPPTINSASSASVTGTAPQLGAMIPGTTGGLPALSGLSVTQNPMAQQLQSMGRGDDKVLVHMTPEEVNSLQGLAMATGGSLTINPHTGLPEAGWLGKLLPTILGAIGMAFGIPPIWMGAAGAVGGTIATGDLGKGLAMGLQAYGGASLGGAAGIGGKLGNVGQSLGLSGSSAIGGGAVGSGGLGVKTTEGLLSSSSTPFGGLFTSGADAAGKSAGVLGGFSNAAKAGAGFLGSKAPLLAGAGVLSGLSAASQPNLPKYTGEENKFNYVSMAPGKREVRFQTPEQMEASEGAEFQYFTPSNPDPVPVSTLPIEEQERYRYADGGPVMAPPQGFNELVDYFGASNPGAITASMKYPTPTSPPLNTDPGAGFYNPTPVHGGGAGPGVGYTGNIPNFGGFDNFSFDLNAFRDNFERNQLQQLIGQQSNYETLYDFGMPTPSLGPSPSEMDYGYIDIPGVGNVQIPGFSGYDWNNIDWDAIARQQGYIPQSQAIQLNAPTTDLSGLYDRFGALESQLQQLPTQMPTYQEPDLSGIYDRLNQFDSRLESLPATFDIGGELSGIYDRFGALESRLQQLPTELPTYQAPDLSGIYDRFGAIESRLQQLPTELPTYQAPDLSGIYDRFGAIESRLQQLPTELPTYQAPDLSGIYDRFGAIESQLQSLPRELPTYQQPDLSGIYDRLNQFDARLESLPETYDIGGELSGLYDRFGNIESQLQSLPRELPTYQQPDLSGIYDRFGALESRFNSMPTYQAPDMSGIYDRFGAIESQLQSLPRELPTYQQPDLSGIYDRFGALESRFNSMPTYQQPDLSGIYDRFGAIESQLQSLPRELPTYQQPDLSGIYDRFGALESRFNSMPTYQAPDMSGIYSRLDQLGSQFNSMPSYEAPDLSGIYDRFGAIESQLQSLPREMPTYQQPDLSGIYDRFGALESRFNSMPTYQAPDLSGIYSRLDQLGSQFNSMPTYQAPDLSGIYDRFGNIESQLQSLPRELPTYQQPDLSGIYDRFGAIESQLQSLPRELPTYQQPDLSGIYSQLEQIRSMFAPQYESGPAIYDMNADQYQSVGEFAEGGTVNMRDGSFVVDARTVSELGNGSSNAGMELLSRMGGKPVRGPGDGVSDSVKASIGGKQEARVARDEVIFPPEAVRHMGGGSEKRGTAKLYNLMEHAHKARKKAKRGQDTGLRRGLA